MLGAGTGGWVARWGCVHRGCLGLARGVELHAGLLVGCWVARGCSGPARGVGLPAGAWGRCGGWVARGCRKPLWAQRAAWNTQHAIVTGSLKFSAVRSIHNIQTTISILLYNTNITISILLYNTNITISILLYNTNNHLNTVVQYKHNHLNTVVQYKHNHLNTVVQYKQPSQYCCTIQT